MLSMGKSLMIFNKVEPIEDIERKLDSITAGQLTEIAGDILDDKKMSYLLYQ
jgi:hypothetical protein